MNLRLKAGTEPFEFKGNAKEWFGIWIVNLLLSIITLGIYSAWAKVRTKKYFANNTFVAGRNFDYHATGKQILIGRLIVVGAFILLQVMTVVLPVVGLVLLLAVVIAYPWLIVRSMQFNARMTSYSNVRFGFVGKIGQAFLVFMIYPFLMALTLYTTFPILDRAVKRYAINNRKLGQASFTFDAGLGAFYKAFLIAIAWAVGVMVIGATVFGVSLLGFGEAMADLETNPAAAAGIIGMFYLFFFAALLPAGFIYSALTRNTVYNGLELDGGHRFVSTVTAPKMLWIAVSNAVVVICTFLLMLPWAQVRMSRYLAQNTGLIPGGSLDEFIDEQHAAGSTMGAAYTDLEGIDVGLPI